MWRRSLQLRVVTITLVASGLLVGGFAYMVASQSTNILLDRAREDVQRRLEHGRDYAAEQLSAHPQYFDPQVRVTVEQTVSTLAGGDPDQVGGVVVVMTASGHPLIQSATSPAVDVSGMITPELAGYVGSGAQAYQIRTGDLGEGRLKYLVYGSPVPTNFGQVELFYLAPLTTQDQAANQIRATVLITGLALVMLLGLLAALITRLVVRPVRVAARTAQRLSAGLLDQRMVVDGEDDLAMLAASFNQMASNLQRQITRLEEMSRLQRRFTSDVSHELRTPLTTVRMAADLIFAERDGFDPAVARSAELLQAELDRFESLLTDLLEISRFDAGFAVLDSEPTDLVPVVRRVVDRLDGLAERLGVEIDLRLPDAPVIAEVDPRRVERVLRNLLGNAVEHGERRPVVVTLGMDDAAVAITVRDHGVGLRPGEEKLVFNRFWRADPSRARQTGGTGLGLSISVEDARLHGGWLEAWGAPGEGAQFRLTLPARAGDRLNSSPLRLVPDDRAGGGLPAGGLPAVLAAAVGAADGDLVPAARSSTEDSADTRGGQQPGGTTGTGGTTRAGGPAGAAGTVVVEGTTSAGASS
jgi:two-component system, OmpR family, sensor histidine kinase MtrB